MLFICYPRCSTCQRAQSWLDERGISYVRRHIKEDSPTAQELLCWKEISGIPMARFFNTNGQMYRRMELKDNLSAMTDEEMAALLAGDGMLVKRPLLVGEDFVLVGFREGDWAARLEKNNH